MTKMWCETCKHWCNVSNKIGDCSHPEAPGGLNRFKHFYEGCLLYERKIIVGVALEDSRKDGTVKAIWW